MNLWNFRLGRGQKNQPLLPLTTPLGPPLHWIVGEIVSLGVSPLFTGGNWPSRA